MVKVFKAKQKRLKELFDVTSKSLGLKKQSEKQIFQRFLDQFFRSFPYENIEGQGIDVLSDQVGAIWKGIQKRSPGKSILQLETVTLPGKISPRLIIFTVNNDGPFLVDSIATYLKSQGLEVELKSHPVLSVIRDKPGNLVDVLDAAASDPKLKSESMIWIQIKADLSSQEMKKVEKDLKGLLSHVRNVVSDFQDVRHTLYTLSNQAESLETILGNMKKQATIGNPTPVGANDLSNVYSFLRWLDSDHFVFLGSRYYKLKSNGDGINLEECTTSPRLGLFKDKTLSAIPEIQPSFFKEEVQQGKKKTKKSLAPLTFFKTNMRSQVHRPSRIDSVEVVDFSADGKARGVYQFVGMLTNLGYSRSAFSVPILNKKVQKVFQRFGLLPQWHDGKSLTNIIDSIPQDELLHLTEDEIYTICARVLQLTDSGRLVSFIRADKFGRQATVILYLTRDHYSSEIKEKLGNIVSEELGGRLGSTNVLVSDLPFARIIYVISFDQPRAIKFDLEAIEEKLVLASFSWSDQLEKLLHGEHNEAKASQLFAHYKDTFPRSYMESFTPKIGVSDIGYLEKIRTTQPIAIKLTKKDGDELRVKVFHRDKPISLSTLLPMLQNLGLDIITETPYCLNLPDQEVWAHSIEARTPKLKDWDLVANNLSTTFSKVWDGEIENDAFNQLILRANLTWQQISVARGYAHFLKQVKLPYSMPYVEQTLSAHPKITAQLIDLFEVLFDPKRSKNREGESQKIIRAIKKSLQDVSRLDHDVILRRLLNAITSTVRTNFYQSLQNGKSYISFKFDCSKLMDIPQPRPLYEIFVYSPRVEAVHLRGGKVARGGIRWSDRLEDFRTEILGLVKAQMVKNSVIVPLGSKGGFIVKKHEMFKDRAELMTEVQACYKMMMSGLLDVTDTIQIGKGGKSKIVAPANVVRHDEDDPYLVVAADKGTATFSDIANGIAGDYGFWLDDAFASGGSQGYDHKKMGITARGAWESVKRHFREMGHDTQKQPFTVIGVGDMSGDVFGNGMLLSDQIKLVAAFNHMHIFIDPDPDPAKSFKERQRLFKLPRSAWTDYDKKVMSKGAQIYDRSAKSLKLTPEIKALLGLDVTEITPDKLLSAILRAQADLLWFGGIGTYIKSRDESNADAGDRGNDAIRINAHELRVKVVGEGANLGMTQLARIEYGLKGGRSNTDAIDNSAGVDCSDHEVNIKILFSSLESAGKITRKQRNKLLEDMTDEVAQLVLRDNYLQTQILTFMQQMGAQGLKQFQTLMKTLEQEANLSRAIEYLPEDEDIESRILQGQPLTRAELSVLLAYAKISLYEVIIHSDLPDRGMYKTCLYEYFPKVLQRKYPKEIAQHLLQREIIATTIANELINRAGPLFLYDVALIAGKDRASVAHAFFLAVHALGLNELWQEIELLDPLMIADLQTQCFMDIRKILVLSTLWFLRHDIADQLSEKNLKQIQNLIKDVRKYLHRDQCDYIGQSVQRFEEKGIKKEGLAHRLSIIPYLPAFLDIVNISNATRTTQDNVASVYFFLRDRFSLDKLLIMADQITVEEEWQKTARAQLVDDLAKIQERLTLRVINESMGCTSKACNVSEWMTGHQDLADQISHVLATIKSDDKASLSLLGFVVRQLQKMIQ